MCQEKKNYIIARLQSSCLITFFKKNTKAGTESAETVTIGIL